MLINPNVAINEGWITHPDDNFNWDKHIQPNAVDFTINHLFDINENEPFIISEQGKQMRGGSVISPSLNTDDNIEYWELHPHTAYDFMSDMYVSIPEGIACILIIRSTFNRNGIFLTSGLYDSLFQGNIAGALHNRSGIARVSPGTRIGQIKFIASDNEGGYAGQYNTEMGHHWSETFNGKESS